MKIVSVTVTSDARADMIGDALKSVVEWVDKCLILHILDHGGEHPDNTLEVAQEVAGEKCHIQDITVGTMDEMRNQGLMFATAMGADWACILDTDERIVANGVDIRKTLQDVPMEVGALNCCHTSGFYDKPRFIRLPTNLSYKGKTHENLVDTEGHEAPHGLLKGIRFDELPKSPEQTKANLEWQLRDIEEALVKEPTSPRWLFYRAYILEAQGRWQEATKAYNKAAHVTTDARMMAWIGYRGAHCFLQCGDVVQAWTLLSSSFGCAPDFPEIPCLLGYIKVASGYWKEAVSWAKIALVHSWTIQPDETRASFKDPESLFEGPYHLLAKAYAGLGDMGKHKWALQKAEWAARKRIRYFQDGKI